MFEREELEEKRKEMMKLYEKVIVEDTEGVLGKYSFVDHLITMIIYLEFEIQRVKNIGIENYNNWIKPWR